jgi:N-methylhydantoinase A
VAYGQGGTEPTVTDANLVLGRINPANAIGREAGFRLDVAAARRAIAQTIGQPLKLEPTAAAWAILQVANHKIAAGIRMLTVEQGLDPRDFALMAYGGAGPLHAAALLRELEVARALVPPWPGITSALGCLTAEVRYDFVQSVNERLERVEPETLYGIMDAHVAEGRAQIVHTGVAIERVDVRYQADMAYDGQIHEVRTSLPEARADRDALRAAFEAAYRAQYGDVVGERAVRVVTLRTAVIGVRPTLQPRPQVAPPGATLEAARKEVRPVYFAEGFRETPIYERTRLPADADFTGPAVVEQGDATTVVEPGMRCRVDGAANLVLERVR